MERVPEAEGSETTGTSFTVVDAVKQIAAYNARAELDNEHQLLLFLQSWWSRTYDRPLKDPILASYTLEELLYEFYDRIEREKAREENAQAESDRIEEAKDKSVLDWIAEEEKKEGSDQVPTEQDKNTTEDGAVDPTTDPENIKWMQEQLMQAKSQYGDSFGEDIEENFE